MKGIDSSVQARGGSPVAIHVNGIAVSRPESSGGAARGRSKWEAISENQLSVVMVAFLGLAHLPWGWGCVFW